MPLNELIFAEIKLLYSELKDAEGIEKDSIPERSSNILFDQIITDNQLIRKTRKLFVDGHHARAIEEAYKYIDNLVKSKSGLDITGSKLMLQVFSVNNPILKMNALGNDSEKDEQQGYMQVLAGCMTGIRNPRAHESDWEDSEIRALQLLVFANHLIEKISNSKK